MRLVVGITMVTLACAAHPPVITQPAHIAVERNDSRSAPSPTVAWDTDFWHAITTLNFRVAWAVSDSREERQFADGLQLMAEGKLDDADSTVTPLLQTSDTLVRNAARVTYDALLSVRSQWQRLAMLADSAPATLRDAAGVEAWAPAFRTGRPHVEFSEKLSTLPLTRTATGVPIVTVRVNGVLKHFWIDTGSSITILSAPVATECGVSPTGHDTLELLTAVGRIAARPTIVSSIRLAGISFSDVPAMIVDSATLKLRMGGVASVQATTIDGVIGFDMIRQIDLTIDDVQQKLVIKQPVVQSGKGRRPRNLFWFGVPIVTLLSEHGTSVYLALDTGAEETYGTRTMVTKTGTRAVVAERRSVNGFGGSITERGVVVPSLRLFLDGVPLLFQRVFLYSAQYPTIFQLDGTLGADVGRGTVG